MRIITPNQTKYNNDCEDDNKRGGYKLKKGIPF